jgi:hypothetical protein
VRFLIGFSFLVGEALLGDFNACLLARLLGGWVRAATFARFSLEDKLFFNLRII